MQRPFSLFNQFIHISLIAYIGLIGPMVYVKPHSPHEIALPTYELSIFQATNQSSVLIELRQRLQQSEIWLPTVPFWRNWHPVISERVAIPILTYGVQGILGHVYLEVDVPRLDISLYPFSQDWVSPLIKHSLDLPPPDKPPSL